MLYKTGCTRILFREILSQEIRVFFSGTGEKGSVYVTALSDDKTFIEVRDFSRKSHSYSINRM